MHNKVRHKKTIYVVFFFIECAKLFLGVNLGGLLSVGLHSGLGQGTY